MNRQSLPVILLALSLTVLPGRAAETQVEPGPEAGGLRMRLLVASAAQQGTEGYRVQVDLINVTRDKIAVRPSRPWSRTEGGIEAHLEAAVSIESYPAIEPWLGQVMADRGEKSPPEYTLAAGETLSLKWQTSRRHLKNLVTNPLEVQNPEFAENGLYSIHATLGVMAGGHPVILRSNEQLVAFGGSLGLPKHTYGQVRWSEEKSRSAELNLGSQHKVTVGDRFLIQTGTIGWTWTLTISKVEDDTSTGSLAPSQENPPLPFPRWGSFAALISKK
jgi:hypothetical protein